MSAIGKMAGIVAAIALVSGVAVGISWAIRPTPEEECRAATEAVVHSMLVTPQGQKVPNRILTRGQARCEGVPTGRAIVQSVMAQHADELAAKVEREVKP